MKKILFFPLLVLFFVTGCAKTYNPHDLLYCYGNLYECEDIEVRVKQLSEMECNTLFSNRINTKKYIALQIAVENNRQTPIELLGVNIDLKLVPLFKLKNEAHSAFYFATEYERAFVENNVDRDLEKKVFGLESSVTLYKNERLNRVMFIEKKNFKQAFSIKSVDVKTGQQFSMNYSL